MNNLSLNENENVNKVFSRFHKTLINVLDQFAPMIKKINKTTSVLRGYQIKLKTSSLKKYAASFIGAK